MALPPIQRSIVHDVVEVGETRTREDKLTVTLTAYSFNDNYTSGNVIQLTRAAAAGLATQILTILMGE